ncbi:MAG: hypothetical protein HY858_05860 [Candidatus Solibacter usitatus]|nr:hypothetical protein [Candidatus Solibacter usitatus]
MPRSLFAPVFMLLAALRAAAPAAELPGAYYRILNESLPQIRQHFAAHSAGGLKTLEAAAPWRHFPHALLVAAVLHARPHAANIAYGRPELLEIALAIGDLCATEMEQGSFTARLDHHRDSYMWLEAYRLLEPKLGAARRARWRKALLTEFNDLAAMIAERQNYPRYASPFLGTSPNHFALWSSTLYLASKVFHNPDWEKLSAKVLHRFAAEEQTPDGFWGEHTTNGPTTGYDYVTVASVALYWEHSGDPAALAALRRNADFHQYFTYPDGIPVETVNDRNRYWEVTPWGQFGFTHFPAGRRYAAFLTSFHRPGQVAIEALGRMAQNALYYHAGPLAPIPQDRPNYAHQMRVPAGIRKTGPWVICLSGIVAPPTENQFYLERQSAISVFHQRTGLIVTGANSKRQPELATISDRINGQATHMPVSTRLTMSDAGDSLALAFNGFFSVLHVAPPSSGALTLRFDFLINWRKPDGALTLQLCLKPGELLETGAGRSFTVGTGKLELGPEAIGGWIRHNGWTLKTAAAARLTWPVMPYNPYLNGPETDIARAVAALATPLPAQKAALSFTIEVD